MIKIVSYFNVLCPFFYHWCLFIFTRHSIRVTTYFQTICYCCWSFQNSSDQTDTFVHVCLLLMFDIYHSPVSVWDVLSPLNYLPVTAWCFPETAQTRLMCLFTCVCVLDVRSVTSWDDFGDSHTCRGRGRGSVCTNSRTKKRAGGMKKDAALAFALVLEQKGVCIPAFIPFSVLTPLNFAATVTGWSISECWKGAVSTASGKSRSAPSTGWWTSTELTASPLRKWSASETLPRPLTCSPRRDVTLTPTHTEAARRSPSSQPASTLAQKESPPHVCWGYD